MYHGQIERYCKTIFEALKGKVKYWVTVINAFNEEEIWIYLCG